MNRIAPYALHMSCDHTTFICPREVRRAPRIVVPSRDGLVVRPAKVMTTLHYCDLHAWDFRPEEYWTGDQKARLEKTLRETGRPDFRPDFERSRIEMVLVTTPEYQDFLWHVGRRLRAA